ncbi:MAG: UbiA family prenyltransferase [Pseudomonadota bacterium]|nr:MAG: UbiA family prenyltransferase [Pseudomonadota bacterium]
MAAEIEVGERVPVLCVDMDGTLLRTDTLYESVLVLLKRYPLQCLRAPFWLLGGKAHFKAQVARHVHLSPRCLPFNEELLAYLKEQKEEGRTLVLATAANRRVAEAVAGSVGIFDEVIASDAERNLSGPNKAAALRERFGEKGFAYAANGEIDLSVWRDAAAAVIVNAGTRLRTAAEKLTLVEAEFPRKAEVTLPTLVRAIRVHQWIKNLLIFVPLVLAHEITDISRVLAALQAFFAFGLCASSMYVFNDLMDLHADRRHPDKRHRPFASGALSIQLGLALVPVLLIAAFAVAAPLPAAVSLLLLVYMALTLLYSISLKRMVLLDVLILAGLYTLRIVVGTLAIEVPISYWLLAFSTFIFFSLAMVKRYSELLALMDRNEEKSHGRGYVTQDIELLGNLGAASAYISVLVMALYINDPAITVAYTHSEWLWLVCPALLYWISRIWLMAHRGLIHEDPVIYAVRDKASFVVAGIALFAIYMAL